MYIGQDAYGFGTTTGAVKKIGISGSAVTTLASGLNYPGAIAVDSTSIYWTERNSIKKLAK